MLAYILVAIIILTVYRNLIDMHSETFVSDVSCTSKDDYNETMEKYTTSASYKYTSGTLGNYAFKYKNARSTPLDSNNLNSFNNNLTTFYNNCLSDIKDRISNTEDEFNTKFKDYI